jgi:hypothetical protein
LRLVSPRHAAALLSGVLLFADRSVALAQLVPGQAPAPAPAPTEDPFARFESPSLMLRMQSLASTAHAGEWRIGGAFEYGTPGPGNYGSLQTGLSLRTHFDGGWVNVGDHGGGYIAPGARVAVAWAGEARSTDIAFGIGVLTTPVLSFVSGAQRLSFAIEPGVFFRFHVFGLTAGTPFEVEGYGWNDGPWSRGAFGGALGGVSLGLGLFIPGNRW